MLLRYDVIEFLKISDGNKLTFRIKNTGFVFQWYYSDPFSVTKNPPPKELQGHWITDKGIRSKGLKLGNKIVAFNVFATRIYNKHKPKQINNEASTKRKGTTTTGIERAVKGKGDNVQQIREQKEKINESLSKTKGTSTTRKANKISGIKRAVKGKEDNVRRIHNQQKQKKKQKNNEISSKTKVTTTTQKANKISGIKRAVKGEADKAPPTEKIKAVIEPDETAHPYKSLLIMAGAERPQEHFPEHFPEEVDSSTSSDIEADVLKALLSEINGNAQTGAKPAQKSCGPRPDYQILID
jgi:hypothetical protein